MPERTSPKPGRRALLAAGGSLVKHGAARQEDRMSDRPAKPSREERLAARLRENLHRRKAQTRALDSARSEPQSDLSKPDASR